MNERLASLRQEIPPIEGRIAIYGAGTLERYSQNILAAGFQKVAVELPEDVAGTIYQIHGNQDAIEDDRLIMETLATDLGSDTGSPAVVLLHRPDEIQDRLPELRAVLAGGRRKFGLTFLGDMHLQDEFYDTDLATRKVIPHGFFDVTKPPEPTDKIVIGTHTTWGDMRGTKHLLELLGEVFTLNQEERRIWGYLGGKPAAKLDIATLQQAFTGLFPNIPVRFQAANEVLNDAASNTIFVDDKNLQPAGLDITFNTQMYYYGDRIRTGESSGSVHSGVSVPVILEMNGSENIEDLEVVKVPYDKTTMAIDSADFKRAAMAIVEIAKNNEHAGMLQHNFEQAQRFNNEYVARQYLALFESLAS